MTRQHANHFGFGLSPEYEGRPRRTPHEYPYSYDPYLIWGEENGHAVYTDRLRQWEPDKHTKLCKKHFGEKDPSNRTCFDFEPKNVEAYLCDYMGKPIQLTGIMQHCNWATGYPLWTFHFIEKGEKE